MRTRTVTAGILSAFLILSLPLTAPAGHSSTRVFIGGSIAVGPPAYGPYYGPGWWGPGYYAPPPVYYAPPTVQQPPVYVERGQSDSDY